MALLAAMTDRVSLSYLAKTSHWWFLSPSCYYTDTGLPLHNMNMTTKHASTWALVLLLVLVDRCKWSLPHYHTSITSL